MSTLSTPALNDLETALDAAAVQLRQLFADNARLRSELAEANARMRAAGHQLRVVAERLPHTAAVSAADSVDAAQPQTQPQPQAQAA